MRAARCQSSSGKVWWSKRSGRIASRRWLRVQRRTLLTPVSCSEAKVIVCIKLAPERAVGGVGVAIVQLSIACEASKVQMHLRVEIPGLQRVSFRTKLHACARTSTTPLISAFVFLRPDRRTSTFTRQTKDAHPTCCEPSASPPVDQHSRVRGLDRHPGINGASESYRSMNND